MTSKLKLIIMIATVYSVVSCNSSSDKSESKTDTTISQNTNDTTIKHLEETTNNGLMTAMTRMMDRMKTYQMTGDFDIDFANMMIEHHQGAVAMSEIELNSGKDAKMKEMAQKIITAQTAEVTELKDFVKTYKPSGMKHGEGELQKAMTEMETKMKGMQMTGETDKDFAMMMIQHHEDGISMSEKQLTNSMSDKLKKMAQKGITSSNKEIKEFKSWLQK